MKLNSLFEDKIISSSGQFRLIEGVFKKTGSPLVIAISTVDNKKYVLRDSIKNFSRWQEYIGKAINVHSYEILTKYRIDTNQGNLNPINIEAKL